MSSELRASSYIVLPQGEPLFSEQATYISVDLVQLRVKIADDSYQ